MNQRLKRTLPLMDINVYLLPVSSHLFKHLPCLVTVHYQMHIYSVNHCACAEEGFHWKMFITEHEL